jgi:hypothetical protein
MRKLHIFGVAVVAICALGAWFVASATAEEPGLFLANGAEILAELGATTEGELLFENLKTPSAKFLCSGIFDGHILTNGEDYQVDKLLTLGRVEVPESDTVANLACTPDEGSICTSAAVSPVNLPWLSNPDLVTETDFFLLALPNANNLLPAYFLLCQAIVDNTELCELLLETAQLVENGATDVVFPAGTSPTPDAFCSGTLEESGGLFVDTALLFLTDGSTLSISP